MIINLIQLSEDRREVKGLRQDFSCVKLQQASQIVTTDIVRKKKKPRETKKEEERRWKTLNYKVLLRCSIHLRIQEMFKLLHTSSFYKLDHALHFSHLNTCSTRQGIDVSAGEQQFNAASLTALHCTALASCLH